MPLAVLLALCVGLSALTGCAHDEQEPAPRVAQPDTGLIVIGSESLMLDKIVVQQVQNQRIPATSVSVPARIEPDPVRMANIRVPASGRLLKVAVRAGDAVEEGQLLMTLDSAEAEAAVSEHNQAQVSAQKAANDFTRAKELYRIEAIPQRELFAAELEVIHARAELSQAERTLRILGLEAEQPDQALRLVSPLQGRVLNINVSRGEYVSDDEVLAVVADLNRVMAVASVPENRLAPLAPGNEVNVALSAYPGELLSGQIRRISDSLDEDTRTVRVYVELLNDEQRLRPGMFGTVHFSSEIADFPVVPVGTVVYQNNRSLVLVEVEPGEFEMRVVTPGTSTNGLLPIIEGLRSGERVVTDGAILVMAQRRAP